MENSNERIENWNEIFCEVIRRIGWDYLELSDHSTKRIGNIDDYRNDPIGLSLTQLRIFTFDLRNLVSKQVRTEILRVYNNFGMYSGTSMKQINDSIMDNYISHFTLAINEIRDYLDKN